MKTVQHLILTFAFLFSLSIISEVAAQTAQPSETLFVQIGQGSNAFSLTQSNTTIVIDVDSDLLITGGTATHNGETDALEVSIIPGSNQTTMSADHDGILIIITDGEPAAAAGRQKNRRVEMEVVFE